MSDSPAPKKHRGAPYGNKNALKYGFYTREMNDHDVDGLDLIPTFSLMDEIQIMRVFVRKVVELSSGIETLEEALDTLRALSNATRGINRLVRTQQIIIPPKSELDRQFNAIFEKILNEMEEEIKNGNEAAQVVTPQ